MEIRYYGDKISERIAKTPEGFLICQDVPISRTGYQEYLASELMENPVNKHKIIPVYRPAKEVFDIRSLASFEGKPVTNEHPDEDVTPENYQRYSCGHVQNVHVGEGKDSNKVLADLYITDPTLIHLIQSGKREISCGYYAEERRDDTGKFFQTKIRGNHVAVVTSGRAGKTVCIRDKKPSVRKKNFSLGRRAMRNLMDKQYRDYYPKRRKNRHKQALMDAGVKGMKKGQHIKAKDPDYMRALKIGGAVAGGAAALGGAALAIKNRHAIGNAVRGLVGRKKALTGTANAVKQVSAPDKLSAEIKLASMKAAKNAAKKPGLFSRAASAVKRGVSNAALSARIHRAAASNAIKRGVSKAGKAGSDARLSAQIKLASRKPKIFSARKGLDSMPYYKRKLYEGRNSMYYKDYLPKRGRRYLLDEDVLEDEDLILEDEEDILEDDDLILEDEDELLEDDEYLEDEDELLEDDEDVILEDNDYLEDEDDYLEDEDELIEDDEDIILEDEDEYVEDEDELLEDEDELFEDDEDDIVVDDDYLEDEDEYIEDEDEILEDEDEYVEDEDEILEDEDEDVTTQAAQVLRDAKKILRDAKRQLRRIKMRDAIIVNDDDLEEDEEEVIEDEDELLEDEDEILEDEDELLEDEDEILEDEDELIEDDDEVLEDDDEILEDDEFEEDEDEVVEDEDEILEDGCHSDEEEAIDTDKAKALREITEASRNITDPNERKQLQDAIYKSLCKKSQMSDVMRITKKNRKSRMDAALVGSGKVNLEAQQSIYDSFNPHKKTSF